MKIKIDKYVKCEKWADNFTFHGIIMESLNVSNFVFIGICVLLSIIGSIIIAKSGEN